MELSKIYLNMTREAYALLYATLLRQYTNARNTKIYILVYIDVSIWSK